MLRTLVLDPILVDQDQLTSAVDRSPFDDLARLLLARVGRMAEQVVDSVQ